MGKTCKKCGFALDDEAQFCSRCGTEVAVLRCHQCGKVIPEDASFCPFCGTAAASVEKQQKAENADKSEPAEDVEDTMEQDDPQSSSEFPCTAGAPVEEDDGLSFTCGYFNLLNVFTEIKSQLCKDYILIRRRFGRNTAEYKTLAQIPYKEVAGTEVRSRNSPLLILLFTALLALIPCLAFSENCDPLIAFVVFLFTLLGIWRFSFQIHHLNLVITEKSGQETAIPFKNKQELFEIQTLIQERLEEQRISEETVQNIVRKSTPYYCREFQEIFAGRKGKFNWPAFLFGPIFCFYRSGGRLFREFFLTYFSLFGLFSVIVSWVTTLFIQAGVSMMPWIITGIAGGIALQIYGLVCMIRCGREFNWRYAQYCCVQVSMDPKAVKQKEGSVSKAILAGLLLSIYTAIVPTICGMWITSAYTDHTLSGLGGYNSSFEDDATTDEDSGYYDSSADPGEDVTGGYETTDLEGYLGKWYASNLDGTPAFRTEQYLYDDAYQPIFGLQLELLQIDGMYYAYLYSNLHWFDYGFEYQTLDGDMLLPVTQIDGTTWEIRYDETDPSSEDYRIIGKPIVTLSVNPLGELYAEITESDTPIGRTKLYSSREWLGGTFEFYDETDSYYDYGEFDTGSPITAFECAAFIQNLYGTWFSDTGAASDNLYLDGDGIWVYAMRGNFYRDYSYDLDIRFSYDAEYMHTLNIPASPEGNYTELYLDGTHYSR